MIQIPPGPILQIRHCFDKSVIRTEPISNKNKFTHAFIFSSSFNNTDKI